MIQFDSVMDSATENYDHGKWVYLPHSCDSWVIGGKGEVEQMIKDLTEILIQFY